jgi:hypothetical protein
MLSPLRAESAAFVAERMQNINAAIDDQNESVS